MPTIESSAAAIMSEPTGPQASGSVSPTVNVGSWNGHIFAVSATQVLSFTGLQIKAASNTKEKTKSKQKYVARKSGKPTEVSLTIVLHRQLGCDVRAESDGFLADAKAGKADYFYVGNGKLTPCKLMLTDATVKDINITPSGTWESASLQLTMKQSSKNDSSGTSSSKKKKKKSSGGSKKASVKKSSTTSSSKSSSKKTTTTKKSSSDSGEHKSLIHDFYVHKQEAAAKKTVSDAKKTTGAQKTTKNPERAKRYNPDAPIL